MGTLSWNMRGSNVITRAFLRGRGRQEHERRRENGAEGRGRDLRMVRFWLKKEEGAMSQGTEGHLDSGKSKEMNSPLELLAGTRSRRRLDFSPLDPYQTLHNHRTINPGCPKPLHTWSFATAAVGNYTEREEIREKTLSSPDSAPDQGTSLSPSYSHPDAQ